MQGYWDSLYAAGADVVVGGDDHVYERYAPQDPHGAYDPRRGLRQFTVGTGGGSLYGFETRGRQQRSPLPSVLRGPEARASYGRGYEWQFVAAGPTRVIDAGSDGCH